MIFLHNFRCIQNYKNHFENAKFIKNYFSYNLL